MEEEFIGSATLGVVIAAELLVMMESHLQALQLYLSMENRYAELAIMYHAVQRWLKALLMFSLDNL
jgi:hypothetical protein